MQVAASASARAGDNIETVVVVGNAPLSGASIDPDKIAGEIQTISISDLTGDRQAGVLPDAVASQLSSVDEQGSQFQPHFVYRGFEASPISGVAEGLAVYQDGVRLNESFGDNVNWDLVPQFAVNRLIIRSNNSVFGLNRLAGAVTLAMKSGLTFQGTDAQLSGGSFVKVTGSAEIGGRDGKLGFYLCVGGVHDDASAIIHPPTCGSPMAIWLMSPTAGRCIPALPPRTQFLPDRIGFAVFGEVENVFDRHYATYGSLIGLGRQVGEIAQQEGEHVIDVWFDISLASDLLADFCTASPVGTDPHRTAEPVLHPQALAGTSDGGAHMRFFSGGHWLTELLIWLVRESGVISLEEMPIAFLISPRAWRA